jgi:hypothetical protein
MELGYERTKRLKEGHPNGFEVRRSFVGKALVLLIGGAGDALKIAVEADGLRIGGNLPFGSTEDDAYVAGVKLQEARRNGINFQGLVDGGKDNNVVLGYLDDDAAASQIGDDLVFALLSLGENASGEKSSGEE